MVSLSLLVEKTYERSFFGQNLGLAGVVSAVGHDVTNVKVGDKLMIGEPACFTNRLKCPAARCVPLSGGVSVVGAAATGSVYNTCHHALVNLARVRKGEKVLIYAAAGGIGDAAISICQHLGAEIYATAGTPEKRQLVRARGWSTYTTRARPRCLMTSCATPTARVSTLLLNFLAGKHQRLSIQPLRSSRPFLKVGKVDITDNS
jgi:NADPH:quinone reductase-like Zn-dependent oxidoreductase